MDTIKIFAFCSVFCGVIFLIKQMRAEMGLLLGFAVSIYLLVCAVSVIAPIYSYIDELAQSSYIGEYIPYLTKTIAIGIAAQIAASLCRDCREEGIASKVELLAKTSILGICLPLIKDLLKNAFSLFE